MKVIDYFDLNKRTSTSIECPKCSKHAIVEQPAGVFQCLSCDYRRDFIHDDVSARRQGSSRSDDLKGDKAEPLPLLLALGIFLLLLI